MGNRTSRRGRGDDFDVTGVVFRRSAKVVHSRKNAAGLPQQANGRPVSYAAANADNASRAPPNRHQRRLPNHQLQRRPLSMQSVPSSTMHSDTRLVIGQLCAKRPKYSLLKQIDIDQLEDPIQFLLFESACDLLDQMGTIERLKAEKQLAASVQGGFDAKQTVVGYRQLASMFLSGVAPELLLLTSLRPDELYPRVHRALAGMLRRAAEIRAARIDAVLIELTSSPLPLEQGTSACTTPGNSERVFDLSLRREVERLLDRASDQVVGELASRQGCGAQLLASTAGVQGIGDTGLPLGATEPDAKCTQDFLDACAVWCWRAVSCSGSACPSLHVESPGHCQVPMRFDPRLHATVLGPERAGTAVACVVWPALCAGGVDDVVLCKALVTLVLGG